MRIGKSNEKAAPNSGHSKTGKQSSKARSKKAKRPVKERINLSTKTQAACEPSS